MIRLRATPRIPAGRVKKAILRNGPLGGYRAFLCMDGQFFGQGATKEEAVAALQAKLDDLYHQMDNPLRGEDFYAR